MTPSAFSDFALRLRQFIRTALGAVHEGRQAPPASPDDAFAELAQALFALQFQGNEPFRRLCQARHIQPTRDLDWRDIPAVPTTAFKDLEITALPAAERVHSFLSSGTTGQGPSRHFHSAESLALYEASLLPWFARHLVPDAAGPMRLLCLTPPPASAPQSSLVHMLAAVRRAFGREESGFVGCLDASGAWGLDRAAAVEVLREAISAGEPLAVLGTAFNFVQLLDGLAAERLWLRLPDGSRVMETGGYKGRTRALSRAELHALITERLGVSASHIVCEYGMSELSSQAYDGQAGRAGPSARIFHFPPWARVQVISPETGREVAEGETGLLRVFDLANVWSVMAVQTEDLGVRRGDGFELIGRAALAEPRGCSLQVASLGRTSSTSPTPPTGAGGEGQATLEGQGLAKLVPPSQDLGRTSSTSPTPPAGACGQGKAIWESQGLAKLVPPSQGRKGALAR